jgi:hypothetical protein
MGGRTHFFKENTRDKYGAGRMAIIFFYNEENAELSVISGTSRVFPSFSSTLISSG